MGAADARARMDWGTVVALTWALTAVGATVLIGPSLGLRGLIWLGAHHLLCAVGVTHELLRARRRRAARQAPQ